MSKREVYIFDSQQKKRNLMIKEPLNNAFRSYKRLGGQSKGTKLTWIPAQCAQQPGSLDCGYYVMRFMYDIIMNHCNSQDLTKDFSRTLPYSAEEINEVKDFWADYFMNNVEFLA
ncbi:uncharacterized protein [Spinacia oleracea]|uniref:Ubiquitin-like protease family profile domain-containing protein n=1 Tax=Spinacia oleracea TaxID=3562 RepID=A0ABM3REN7_SPIOL|nr:uncharacterized protein LOC130469121 [Spinacia oleracea]